jgi:hypothetical protein
MSIVFLCIGLSWVGCGLGSDRSVREHVAKPAERFDQSVRERVTKPVALSELDDNVVVLSRLIPGLIATIRIEGDHVFLADAGILLVPNKKPRDATRGCILVKGIAGREVATYQWIPDSEYVTIEKVGMERRQTRQVVFSLPLQRRIDKVVVQLKPNSPTFEFDVTPVISAFCAKYSRSPLCQ